jgi:hypothetical protein
MDTPNPLYSSVSSSISLSHSKPPPLQFPSYTSITGTSLKLKGANNLSKTTQNDQALKVLNQGLKFIPTHNPRPLEVSRILTHSLDKFVTRAHNAFTFRDCESRIPKFYVPSGNKAPPQENEEHLNEQLGSIIKKAGQHHRFKVLSAWKPAPSNLSLAETLELERLKNNSQLVIKPADKNLGPTVMDWSWYNQRILDQLNDRAVYIPITQTDWTQKCAQIRANCYTWNKTHLDFLNVLKSLYPGSTILAFCHEFTKNETCEPCAFYGLPKIHKQPVKLRPISAAHSFMTTGHSAVLADLLQTEVNKVPHILRDTKHLINQLETLPPLPRDCIFMSADVEALYPSIPTQFAIDLIIRRFYSGNRTYTGDIKPQDLGWWDIPQSHPPKRVNARSAIRDLLHLVLDNHHVSFQGQTYHQVQGTAMGTNTGPPYANLFLAALEQPLVAKYKATGDLLFYARYIDDIIAIWRNNPTAAKAFAKEYNELHHNIKITAEFSGISMNFLDLTLTKDDRFLKTGTVDLLPFAKAMNRYLYLSVDSFHPLNTKLGFIKGNLIRLVCNSSSESAYLKEVVFYFNRLRDRGYDKALLSSVFQMVSYANRSNYLKIKSLTKDRKLAFVTPYHPSFQELPFRTSILETIAELEADSSQYIFPEVLSFLKQTHIVSAFTKNRNLGSKLVRATR